MPDLFVKQVPHHSKDLLDYLDVDSLGQRSWKLELEIGLLRWALKEKPVFIDLEQVDCRIDLLVLFAVVTDPSTELFLSTLDHILLCHLALDLSCLLF